MGFEMTTNTSSSLPRTFVWRRWHSLTGLWLVIFLIVHLLANSQAALLIGDDGAGFIKAANDIRNLPYLPAIEIGLLLIPFAIHIYWGVQYLWTGKANSYKSDGSTPSLPEYPRNHAYTWQRITSWILLVLIAAHVVQMRFMEAPTVTGMGKAKSYMVRVESDDGIHTLAERLDVSLYNAQQVPQQQWASALSERPLAPNQLIAVTKDFGTAELLMVRETFKMPLMLLLYTVLVLSACFHAFNGLWTFCITWGVTLSVNSQKNMRRVSLALMFALGFLGLAAIWGSYWINLRQ